MPANLIVKPLPNVPIFIYMHYIELHSAEVQNVLMTMHDRQFVVIFSTNVDLQEFWYKYTRNDQAPCPLAGGFKHVNYQKFLP